MSRIPEGVQRGEARVIEGRWGEVEIRIEHVEGNPRDLPFDGDLGYWVPAGLFEDMRARLEGDGGD